MPFASFNSEQSFPLGYRMYSVKPGRGPSAFGVVGAAIAVVFGLFWTAQASSSGAPDFMVGFGVVFVLVAISSGFYHVYNATASNRASEFDVVHHSEELDPLSQHFSSHPSGSNPGDDTVDGFCPYCGATVTHDFSFCPRCGRPIPPAS